MLEKVTGTRIKSTGGDWPLTKAGKEMENREYRYK